ncbi:nucleoside-diphosphate sugar epimerase [Shewanella sp. WPAGA9]|uniref:nucleoside-diphosphate sugar epimerase n=1 Tax=Shewanella sp. ENK2 TaxID=2775245 RepID=UPI00177BE115|nr:nucleoside-diphosphate sugar epimerase [Shewanella sp. WPAGA9]
MNAVIIGATGLIGQQLLQELLVNEAYEQVVVIGRRRPTINITQQGAAKLCFMQAQLDQIPTLSLPVKIDHAFCCLGTTMKQAGSQVNFIKVDYQAVLDFGRLVVAHQSDNGTALFVVTALNANPNSKVFYNRIKGEIQRDLALLPITSIHYFQPSLLLGSRADKRTLEDIGQQFFAIASGVFIGPLAKYKPITGKLVADNMLAAAVKSNTELVSEPSLATKAVRIIDNKQMHQMVN